MSNNGNIRNSMLRHWKNTSFSLSRSGSKKDKRKSTATIKAPELRTEPAPARSHGEQANDGNEVVNHVATSPNGISLHVTVYIAPENVEKFLAAFKAIFDVVAAEPECLFFEVYKSADEPGKISWVENWSKDREWLMKNQLTKSYYKEYFETTEPMFLKPREARILELLGPGFSMVKGS
ncbi:hypothetical protein AAE478_007040 [Parahypoxylon ruwenzoriense]